MLHRSLWKVFIGICGFQLALVRVLKEVYETSWREAESGTDDPRSLFWCDRRKNILTHSKKAVVYVSSTSWVYNLPTISRERRFLGKLVTKLRCILKVFKLKLKLYQNKTMYRKSSLNATLFGKYWNIIGFFKLWKNSKYHLLSGGAPPGAPVHLDGKHWHMWPF